MMLRNVGRPTPMNRARLNLEPLDWSAILRGGVIYLCPTLGVSIYEIQQDDLSVGLKYHPSRRNRGIVLRYRLPIVSR